MKQTPTITAIVLTHNSQKTLPDTLASLSFCDEIIVVDDDSTDRTVTLAKKYHAHVISRTLGTDFAAQRNAGLSKATSQWALYVDADEIVPPALKREIKQAVSRQEVSGYFIPRRDVMWGKVLRYGETARVRLLRLGRVGSGMWERPVHEVWNIRGKQETLGAFLVHEPHPSLAEFLDDIARYVDINVAYMRSRNIHVPWWHIIVYPVGKFIQNYIVRQGYRDGMPGMIVALVMSLHSFLTRAGVYLAHRSL